MQRILYEDDNLIVRIDKGYLGEYFIMRLTNKERNVASLIIFSEMEIKKLADCSSIILIHNDRVFGSVYIPVVLEEKSLKKSDIEKLFDGREV